MGRFTSWRAHCKRDVGQSAVILLVVVLALGIALLAALVDFGGITQERVRAQTAADAAALASVDGGREAAVRFAAHHGATVVSWVRGPGPDEVTVVVGLGATTATARASNAALTP